MTFNLKKTKKAQLTEYDISQLQAVITQNINAIRALPPAEAADAMGSFQTQLLAMGTTLQEAQQIVPELQSVLEQQQTMQDAILPNPVDKGQPAIVNPIKASTEKKIKSYNLKKAQEVMPPLDPMGLTDSPELMGDNLEMQQGVLSTPTFKSHI